jgi:hypothetical protein
MTPELGETISQERVVNNFDLNLEPEDQISTENLDSFDKQPSSSSAAETFIDSNRGRCLLPSISFTPMFESVSRSSHFGNHVEEACIAQEHFPSMCSSNGRGKR